MTKASALTVEIINTTVLEYPPSMCGATRPATP